MECKNPEFNNDLLISINEDLNDMESDIYIYKIDIYGNCKASCKKIHQLHFSIDEIQYNCPECIDTNYISRCSITPSILNNVSDTSNHILSQLQYENESDTEYNYKSDINHLNLNHDQSDIDEFEQIPELELETFIRENSPLKLLDNYSNTDDIDIDIDNDNDNDIDNDNDNDIDNDNDNDNDIDNDNDNDIDIDFETNSYTDPKILIIKELGSDDNYMSILESYVLESNDSKNDYRSNNLLEIINYI